MNVFNIARAFEQKKERNWDKLFWAIDLHDVIIEGKYSRYNEGRAMFPGAAEVLTNLSYRSDIVLILWSSSHDDAIQDILDWLANDYDIHFEYVNNNPECQNSALCDFEKKFYFNVLLDDKAGFEGLTDWKLIKEELIRIGEWGVPAQIIPFPKT